jgi:hypothetical protein
MMMRCEMIEDTYDSGYFSDGSLPSNEKEEVLNTYFFEHFNNGDSGQEEKRKSHISSIATIELRKHSPVVNNLSKKSSV